jgi:transcriptional regulator NrdR family protein
MKSLRTCNACGHKALKVTDTRFHQEIKLRSGRSIKNVRVRRNVCLNCGQVYKTGEVLFSKL